MVIKEEKEAVTDEIVQQGTQGEEDQPGADPRHVGTPQGHGVASGARRYLPDVCEIRNYVCGL